MRNNKFNYRTLLKNLSPLLTLFYGEVEKINPDTFDNLIDNSTPSNNLIDNDGFYLTDNG